MKKALEGLKGVEKVEMDLERDLFRVTLAERDAPDRARLLAAVRELHYTPSLADPAGFRVAPETTDLAGQPPGLVRQAIDRARAESKRFVIVDCSGDN